LDNEACDALIDPLENREDKEVTIIIGKRKYDYSMKELKR